jgi:(p)ppGpp synthase/HD superfamily hydrolase
MSSSTNLTKFEKLLISARYWLLGMAESNESYFKVLEAMEVSRDHHNGLRNGGDPQFIHQLGIFHHLRTLHKHIKNPVTVYILAFLHDYVEDCSVDPISGSKKYISLGAVEDQFGSEIARKVDLLSKEVLGVKKENYSLDPVFEDEDTSLVKCGDRVNNVSSMVGVFKKARLERYLKETAEEFFPRMKTSRRKFPHQEACYENMKLELVNQISLINHIMDGYEPNE